MLKDAVIRGSLFAAVYHACAAAPSAPSPPHGAQATRWRGVATGCLITRALTVKPERWRLGPDETPARRDPADGRSERLHQ